MLSYIYRIASRLRLELAGVKMERILEFLGMDVRLEQESSHPHVGWFDSAESEVV